MRPQVKFKRHELSDNADGFSKYAHSHFNAILNSYGKYKPLKQPTTCNKCSEKRVKSAYQTICVPCVDRLKVCAKCGVDVKHETITTSNSPNETILLAQIQVEVRRLPERKRRAFLRYLQKAEQGKNTCHWLVASNKWLLETL